MYIPLFLARHESSEGFLSEHVNKKMGRKQHALSGLLTELARKRKDKYQCHHFIFFAVLL
jgi:hypothetical protein